MFFIKSKTYDRFLSAAKEMIILKADLMMIKFLVVPEMK